MPAQSSTGFLSPNPRLNLGPSPSAVPPSMQFRPDHRNRDASSSQVIFHCEAGGREKLEVLLAEGVADADGSEKVEPGEVRGRDDLEEDVQGAGFSQKINA